MCAVPSKVIFCSSLMLNWPGILPRYYYYCYYYYYHYYYHHPHYLVLFNLIYTIIQHNSRVHSLGLQLVWGRSLFEDQVAVARKLKANLFAAQTGKHWLTMNYHCLKEPTNQERLQSAFLRMWDVPSSVVFCSSCILMLPGICFIYFCNPLFISPRAPITIGIVVAFIAHILSISISRSLYFISRELKQQRFWVMDVNRKWTFCIVEQWLG